MFGVFVDAHQHLGILKVADDHFVVEACQEPALEVDQVFALDL